MHADLPVLKLVVGLGATRFESQLESVGGVERVVNQLDWIDGLR